MSLILGILDSGGAAAGAGGSYESIASVTVGSGGSSTVTFTSIPADYTHLQIRGIGRGTGAGTSTNVQFTFNSDTSSNYSFHGLLGNGSTASSEGYGNQSNGRFWMISNGGAGASMFGAFVVDFLDYANTNKYKTIRALAGNDINGSGGYIVLSSSNWRSTSAITSINFTCEGTNFAEYSQFALYGIKGS